MMPGPIHLLKVLLVTALCTCSKASDSGSEKAEDVDSHSQRLLLEKEILKHFDPNMARAMSRFVALAYCGTNLDLPVVEKCPECEDAGFEVVQGSIEELSLAMTYFNKTFQDANYFVLGQMEFKESKERACFVATRGSYNDANWVQNSMEEMVDPGFESCPDCRVLEGYFSIYEAAYPEMHRYFDHHGCEKKTGNPIYVSGHSLGGGFSQILIAGLTDHGYNVALSYLLEPALAGNQGMRDYFVEHIAKDHPPVPVFSLTNGWDLVPGFEKQIELGYRPMPYDLHFDPFTGALTVCFHDGKDPPICSVDRSSWWYHKSLYIDHLVLWYAPGHFQVMDVIREACKKNPNWFKLHAEWAFISLYTTFFGYGLWGFVIRVNLTILFILSLVLICFYWCCFRQPGQLGYSKMSRDVAPEA